MTVGLARRATRPKARSCPASLTFTAANWNTPQTVTVTGVDDGLDDGDVGLQHRHRGRDQRATATTTGSTPADVAVTNTDNDTAGITVTPTGGLTTTEAGGTATFTVVLTQQPTADVTVGLSAPATRPKARSARVADLHGGQLEHARRP